MSLDKKFSLNDVTIAEEKAAYNGVFKIKKFLLKHKLFRGDESKMISRELFCRGNSVGVLLYDPVNNRVGLAKQFRIGCLENEHSPWVWEIIAGVNDKNESAVRVAMRETKEESGIDISEAKLVPICNYYSSPGGTDERLQLFCAIVALPVLEEITGLAEEGEDIFFKTFDFGVALKMLNQGAINNAATIIALQWLELNHGKLLAQQNT